MLVTVGLDYIHFWEGMEMEGGALRPQEVRIYAHIDMIYMCANAYKCPLVFIYFFLLERESVFLVQRLSGCMLQDFTNQIIMT